LPIWDTTWSRRAQSRKTGPEPSRRQPCVKCHGVLHTCTMGVDCDAAGGWSTTTAAAIGIPT
jgi:hypothetical protein